MNVLETMKVGVNAARHEYNRKKPFYLAVAAGIGVIFVAGVAAKEGPVIKDEVSKAIKEFKEKETSEEKAAVVVKTAAKIAGPVLKMVVTIGATEYAITMSYRESHSRMMAAVALAAGSQLELKDFKEAAREVVGKKKVQTIEETQAAKKFSEMPDDPSLYSDSDCNNPDIVEDDMSGIRFRGRYFDVQKGINATFMRLKAGGEPIVWSQLFSDINDYKSGEPIRRIDTTDYFIFDPMDVHHTDNIDDFVRIVYAGPNRYKLVYEVELKPNPDKFGKNMLKEDLARFYNQVGDHAENSWF